jgi:hypothetical protein
MPGFLLHVGAIVLCTHGGQAQPMVPSPRVKVLGQPVVTQACPYVISGCANPVPPVNTGPCVIGQWVTAATRITVMGQPVLLQGGQAACSPTGTPLTIVATQTRVRGI